MSIRTWRCVASSLVLGVMVAAVPATGQPKEGRQDSARSPLTLQFTVAGMSCAGCAEHATAALGKIAGVRKAEVNFRTKRAVLRTNGSVTRDQVRTALGNLGFEARFDGDPAVEPLTPEERRGLDIKTVSRGDAVVLKDHLAPGKVTMFDFFAVWCGPCHLLTPKLEHLVLNDQSLALRKVDISDWESAAAKQATAELRLPGLPYVRIYDAQGGFLGAVHGNHIDQVVDIVEGRRKP